MSKRKPVPPVVLDEDMPDPEVVRRARARQRVEQDKRLVEKYGADPAPVDQTYQDFVDDMVSRMTPQEISRVCAWVREGYAIGETPEGYPPGYVGTIYPE